MFSRGIDIADVSQVINYDMPSIAHGGIDEFVHRIGRTARMGNVGHALSFMTDRNDDIAPDLVQLIMEVGQDVPPFLAHHIPNDGDVETATVADAAGDTEGAWGATDKEDFFSGEESKQAEGPGSW
jgi:ATP-dependent RNA helicase DDX3X